MLTSPFGSQNVYSSALRVQKHLLKGPLGSQIWTKVPSQYKKIQALMPSGSQNAHPSVLWEPKHTLKSPFRSQNVCLNDLFVSKTLLTDRLKYGCVLLGGKTVGAFLSLFHPCLSKSPCMPLKIWLFFISQLPKICWMGLNSGLEGSSPSFTMILFVKKMTQSSL